MQAIQTPEMMSTASGLPLGEFLRLHNKSFSSKCCHHGTTTECILLNNLLVWNKVLWCSGFTLTETDPGVLTLFSCDGDLVTVRSATSLNMSAALISEHKSIKYFCFREIDVNVLVRILAELVKRSDVRGFVLGSTYDGGTRFPFLGSPLNTGPQQVEYAMSSAMMISTMVRMATSLEELQIQDASIRNDAAVALGRELAKKPSLKTLFLSELCREVAISYISTLHAMDPVNRVRVWHVCSLTLRGCNAIQCKQLCNLLVSNTTITYLNLSGIYRRAFDNKADYSHRRENALCDEGVLMLADTLRRAGSVTILVLRNVGFSKEGAAALGRLMVTNTVVRTLDISENELGMEECIALANGLRLARVLKEFIMEKCDVTRSGAVSILEAVRTNEPCTRVTFGNAFAFRDNMFQLDFVQVFLNNYPESMAFLWEIDVVETGQVLLTDLQHVRQIVLKCDRDFPVDTFCAFLQHDGTVVDELRLVLDNASSYIVVQLARSLQRMSGLRSLSLLMNGGTNERAREVLEFLARALEKNATLCSLRLMVQVNDVIHSFAQLISKSKTLNSVEICYALEEPAVHELEQSMTCNYAITEFKVRPDRSRSEKQRIEELAARNRVLQDRALCFMLEGTTVKKRWIKAFELTRDTGTLRRAVMSKLEKSEEEAQFLIDRKLRYLRDHYFIISGISKGKIMCNASPTGATQLHNLNAGCLSHITRYLRVTDVKESSLCG
ncbi:uncharacterized protein LOC135378661 [Ornithodoros turicata]|uniref:uncharacterized protein LOC135378661 n=1 Tax=Ornithodoros turicata TaxID=34597 RepID=UPI0031397E41